MFYFVFKILIGGSMVGIFKGKVGLGVKIIILTDVTRLVSIDW